MRFVLVLAFILKIAAVARAGAVDVVLDLIPGAPGSYPSYLLVEGETLYFRANRLAGVLLLRLFAGLAPLTCDRAADWDDSGTLDLADAISLLGTLFLGAQAPVATAGVCALDLTVDALGCERYPGCGE